MTRISRAETFLKVYWRRFLHLNVIHCISNGKKEQIGVNNDLTKLHKTSIEELKF